MRPAISCKGGGVRDEAPLDSHDEVPTGASFTIIIITIKKSSNLFQKTNKFQVPHKNDDFAGEKLSDIESSKWNEEENFLFSKQQLPTSKRTTAWDSPKTVVPFTTFVCRVFSSPPTLYGWKTWTTREAIKLNRCAVVFREMSGNFFPPNVSLTRMWDVITTWFSLKHQIVLAISKVLFLPNPRLVVSWWTNHWANKCENHRDLCIFTYIYCKTQWSVGKFMQIFQYTIHGSLMGVMFLSLPTM